MNQGTYVSEPTSSTAGVARERFPRLSVIVISGALSVPGTSSAEPTRVWEAPYVHESDATTSGFTRGDPTPGETTRRAITELRRISGLTWEQLGQLFGVSRRSVHFWASGKPLNAGNEERLMRTLDIVLGADRGEARRTRAALLESVDGVTAFALLTEGRFDEARAILGVGAGRRQPELTELGAADKAARAPLSPEELVDAEYDRVHSDPGRARAARTVRNTRRGTT